MDMCFNVLVNPTIAVKDQEELAKHIECGQPGCHPCQKPELDGPMRAAKSQPEDLVFREKARRERRAGDRERGNEIRPVGYRKISFQTAHLAHVLFAVQSMDHTAGAQKKTGFKKSVRKKMKDRGAKGANAHSQEHETQLAHGRIRQHPLDVVVRE